MQGSAFPHAIPLIGTIAGPRVGVVGPTSTINGFAADRNPKRMAILRYGNSGSAAQGASDHDVLDLVGPFPDLQNLRVAVEAGDG